MVMLTKSKFLIGLQCPKYLWSVFNDSKSIPGYDEVTMFIMEQGREVGRWAKKLYPDGIDIPTDDFRQNLFKTKDSLKENKTLFEAGLQAKNLYSRIDILHPSENGAWNIIEVKSSGRLKDEHIPDVAFQRHCCELSGLNIESCFLMHLNTDYVREGEIDVSNLFIKENITQEVDNEMKGIEERISKMFRIIRSKESPFMEIGKQCKSPNPCPLIEDCEGFLPEENVLQLYGGKKKAYELITKGVHAIKDIPSGFKLNGKQNIQRMCAINGNTYVDKGQISNFLNNLKYPLHFMDFETFNYALPLFESTRPYQQVPFQYSLHIMAEDGKVTHNPYLAKGRKDPRREFMNRLRQDILDEGSIIVYNQNFEKRILSDCADAFPEYKEWVDSIFARFVDLLVPFKEFHYYNPDQCGSASLKRVLPAITGRGYEDLEINEGNLASIRFLTTIMEDVSPSLEKKIREDLLNYCSLDTEGMIWIINELKKELN